MQNATGEVREALSRKRLLVVTGAGVSRSLSDGSNAPNWQQLIINGIEYCQDRSLITSDQSDRWKTTVESTDMDDLLSAAEFLTRKLGSSGSDIFARWLEHAVGHLRLASGSISDSISRIANSGTPIATLNYDNLLEQLLRLPSLTLADDRQAVDWINRDQAGILHIHGVWNIPNTCVLGIRDYHDAIADERRLLLQRAMATFSSLLFIGCGETFNDPNFEALISWMRANVGAAMPHHYALVREQDYSTRLADKSWQGFVEPISYGKDYVNLPTYLNMLFSTPSKTTISKNVKAAKTKRPEGPSIIAYRKFLLRDCGQMTIEGIRADMETAKQRFEIEKLFVPLSFDPVLPEYLQGLRDDAEEMSAWKRDNPNKVSFHDVLKRSKRVALLALPGGGKTMLLKRLAVAYSDPHRLIAGEDKLPKLDLLPIVIRCREWKEHIRSPIPVILEKLFEITGDWLLKGFADEVRDYLKRGKVILLVDGLDEIHDDASRTVFSEHLESFLADFPKTRLVVTSREAGFDLVAPTIARFCDRWKIAPLPEGSIKMLCSYWHLLMMGNSKEAEEESKLVADVLLTTSALKRLAENPLLLTMLLVVKHGAGRLPPDRVSLYSRATEVLLDTWNIKGHNALNVKEAVPQLACLAYELLMQGKQTASISEMEAILEQARERIPHIARYASDDAHAFLKRVELRSSLLIETGYRSEGTSSVPIYQFRHLTFQEYLASVAVVEGYYFSYDKEHTVLTPLKGNLITDEWKEVIPMVAVLSRKQGSPLLRELVKLGCAEQSKFEKAGAAIWSRPASVSRLTQALIEEAEFPSDLLVATYNLVANFANGCTSSDNWPALARGPYGKDIRSTALRLFMEHSQDHRRSLRNTVALFEAHSQTDDFWRDPTTPSVISSRLMSESADDLARTALLICGSFWLFRGKSPLADETVYNAIEDAVLRANGSPFEAIGWAFGFSRYLRLEDGKTPYGVPRRAVLDKLLGRYEEYVLNRDGSIVTFAIESLSSVPRPSWTPTLSEAVKQHIQRVIADGSNSDGGKRIEEAAVILAYFSSANFSDDAVRDALRGVIRSFGGGLNETLRPLYKQFNIDVQEVARPKTFRNNRSV